MCDRWMQLRLQHRALNGSIRFNHFAQLHGQNCADHLVRLVLRADKVTERIGGKNLPSVFGHKPLSILQDMRMCANDQVSTPICQLFHQLSLGVCDGMAVFHTPMDADHYKICLLPCQMQLLFDHICLTGVDHIRFHCTALRDTVCMLRVGEIRNGHTIDGLQRDTVVVRFAAPETGRHNILRHTSPEAKRCSDAGCAFIIGVVV